MFPCSFCETVSPSEEALTSHMKIRHKSLMNSTCYCMYEKCCRSFNNFYSYKRHITAKHCVSVEKRKSAQRDSIPQRLIDLIHMETQNISVETCSSTQLLTSEKSVEIPPCPSDEDFQRTVDRSVTSFVAELYSEPSLPRSFVSNLINKIDDLYSATLVPMLRQKLNSSDREESVTQLNTMFNVLQQAFDNFKTEYQTMQYFEKMNTLIKPQSIAIDASLKSRFMSGEGRVVVSDVQIQVIQLKAVLKSFLELPNVFSTILSNAEHCRASEPIISALQGEVWKKIEDGFGEKLVLPLVLYFDDFEINNPLGSHRNVHKLGATYFSIGCLPYEYSSMLENIFLAQLHNTVDHKDSGNYRVFSNLTEQITDLEKNGLIIDANGRQQKVYFALLAIIGDNLGIHSICGFTTSFNSLNSCRICLAEKPQAQKQVKEDPRILRTIDNYAKDLANCSRGVNSACIFDEIPSFHVIENGCLDIMHDFFEGICRYEVPKILKGLINDDKLFSLEVLNSRIEHFHTGKTLGKNRPLAISTNSLKTQNLIISASEMSFLIKHLGLIIGDLVPENNQLWELYLALREIISIVLAPLFTVETTKLLEILISEHHALYLTLFSEPLKPKHHLIVHYPRIMRRFGPLRYLSCMRFEAKHKQLKDNAKVVTSRTNPAYTLSLKHQLNLSYRLLNKEGFSNRLCWGPVLSEKLSHLSDFVDFRSVLPPLIDDECISTPWVKINGTAYNKDMIVTVHSSSEDLTFGKIRHIIIHDTRKVSFLYLRLGKVGVARHYHAFEVSETKAWGFISQTDIIYYAPCNLYRMADGKLYVPCD